MSVKILDSNIEIVHSKVRISGVEAEGLLREIETPAYVYDLGKIEEKYAALYNCTSYSPRKIFYAIKACFNPHVLKCLQALGAGIDAVSPSEVEYAVRMGMDPNNIIFTANNMTDAEMEYVHDKGVLCNVGSISRLEKYCAAYPGDSICIRINTGVAAGESELVMVADPYSKFGISMDDVQHAAGIARAHDVKIAGIHVHTGSGIENIEDIKESFSRLARCADREILPDLSFIDFGGGYKARYQESEKGLNIAEFGPFIETLMRDLSSKYGRNLELYLEPGKYLVAECGYFFVEVNTLKTVGPKSIAGTNGSITHFLRIVLYERYHEVINISNPGGVKRKYDIVGNICEGSDYFAKDREVQEIREGDILMFLNAGAYVSSMASVYNMRPLPSEYILHKGSLSLSRKMDDPTSFAEKLLNSYHDI
jgi:diaminopimelate decarboxylase